ncbi:MAG TPA: META domain-containing protein [Brumimicrobium sp.]|nr:META domain-containing protein [Brumimicrobium sp.]
MKIKFIIPLALSAIMAQGCSTVKTETMWVGGLKTECNAGNLEAECLSVNKGEDLTTTSWENFYVDIEGFEFEEGYMKKIEVEAIQLDPKDVPADASSIQYKFVKELEKKKDPRSSLSGNWILATINGGPINKMVVIPNLSVDLKEMRIAGNAGCNRYFAGIEGLSTQKITFSQAGATMMACNNENIESEYLKVLGDVATFDFENDLLNFYDEDGNSILSFLKTDANQVSEALNGEWGAIRVGELEVDEVVPNLFIDINDKKISGSDGCNSYFGTINNFTNDELSFTDTGVTEVMCADMTIPDAFLKAIVNVARYQLNENILLLYDGEGNELIAFERQ